MYKQKAISRLKSFNREEKLSVKIKLERLKLTNEKQKCRLRNQQKRQ